MVSAIAAADRAGDHDAAHQLEATCDDCGAEIDGTDERTARCPPGECHLIDPANEVVAPGGPRLCLKCGWLEASQVTR